MYWGARGGRTPAPSVETEAWEASCRRSATTAARSPVRPARSRRKRRHAQRRPRGAVRRAVPERRRVTTADPHRSSLRTRRRAPRSCAATRPIGRTAAAHARDRRRPLLRKRRRTANCRFHRPRARATPPSPPASAPARRCARTSRNNYPNFHFRRCSDGGLGSYADVGAEGLPEFGCDYGTRVLRVRRSLGRTLRGRRQLGVRARRRVRRRRFHRRLRLDGGGDRRRKAATAPTRRTARPAAHSANARTRRRLRLERARAGPAFSPAPAAREPPPPRHPSTTDPPTPPDAATTSPSRRRASPGRRLPLPLSEPASTSAASGPATSSGARRVRVVGAPFPNSFTGRRRRPGHGTHGLLGTVSKHAPVHHAPRRAAWFGMGLAPVVGYGRPTTAPSQALRVRVSHATRVVTWWAPRMTGTCTKTSCSFRTCRIWSA